jgi:hypothetical protein
VVVVVVLVAVAASQYWCCKPLYAVPFLLQAETVDVSRQQDTNNITQQITFNLPLLLL